jgi:hypothetical protein
VDCGKKMEIIGSNSMQIWEKRKSFFLGQISINFETMQLKKRAKFLSKTLGPLGMFFQFIHFIAM